MHPLTPTPPPSHPPYLLSSRLQSPLGRRPRAHSRPLATERGGGVSPPQSLKAGELPTNPPNLLWAGSSASLTPGGRGGSSWKEGAWDPWDPPPSPTLHGSPSLAPCTPGRERWI